MRENLKQRKLQGAGESYRGWRKLQGAGDSYRGLEIITGTGESYVSN